jgi:hypothetical protein
MIGGAINEVFISNAALTGDDVRELMGGMAAVEPAGKLTTAWGKVKAAY